MKRVPLYYDSKSLLPKQLDGQCGIALLDVPFPETI